MPFLYEIVELSLALVAMLSASTSNAESEQAVSEAEQAKPKVEVVERDQDGKATKVSVGDRIYSLCSDTVQDGCINPRSAGFDWGTQPLDYWPGQTATELRQEREAGQSEEEADAPPQGSEDPEF